MAAVELDKPVQGMKDMDSLGTVLQAVLDTELAVLDTGLAVLDTRADRDTEKDKPFIKGLQDCKSPDKPVQPLGPTKRSTLRAYNK